MLRFFLLVALLCAALAEHADVCTERTPEHDQSAVRAAGNGGYFVFTEALDGYEAGRDYRVVLAGFGEFQEFLLFAQNESGAVQGTWSPLNTSKTTTVNCSGVDNSAVVSLNEDSVSEQEFTWTAPAVSVGSVSFIYTVISNDSSYFDLNALENRPPLQVLAAIPEGCDTSDCDYYAAWTQGNNFDHVDFTLGGNVQGWVALGLSEDRVMGMADFDDVLACQLDAEGAVNVKDTFNFRMGRDNLIDDPDIEEHNLTTQGIFNVQTSSEEGHITCSFSRQKVLNNPSQDRDLVLPSFLFFGLDPDDTAAFNDPLTFHDFRVPIVSEQQVTFNMAQLAGTPQLVPEADRVAIFTEPDEDQDPLGVFTIPDGCEGTSCNYMARWFRDGEDLLFELSANTSGWVAMALSGDAMMSGAAFDDVIACQAEEGGATVNAKDMHNPTGQRRNELDADQTGTQLISGGVMNGRLSCMVRRAINTGDTSQDYPLDQQGFVLFAYGTSPGDAQSILNYHGPSRQLTGPITLTVPEPDEEQDPLGVYTLPAGCEGTSCNYMARWFRDGEDLLFELSANTSGWVAMALSGDAMMSGAAFDDVIACQAEEGGATVNAKDMHNPTGQRRNELDADQTGTQLISGGVMNGRLSCMVRRAINTGDTSQDYPLDQQGFVLFAYGNSPGDAQSILNYHGPSRQLTGPITLTVPEPDEEQGPLGVFTIPAGCAGTSCNYMARWFRDGEDLLFELSANTNGWVAMGLSGDAMMSGAAFDDVIACQAEEGGATVNAKDMHNPAGQRRNELDADQTGTQLISGGVMNGRLSCMVRRAINTGDTSQDYPLDQQGFVLFAYGTSPGEAQSALSRHGMADRRLTGPITLTVQTDSFPPPPPPHPLIRAHGILMLWSWLLLAASAIFYARYTRPAYVNGEWFEVHRALLTASVLLTDVGFIVIFVGLSGFLNFGSTNPVGSAHFVIGCIVVGFQLYNPIIAAFRCHPGTKLRFIFDFIHGIMVGTVVELLAFINCALGLWRFVEASQNRHEEQFYLYIVLLIVVVLFEVGMGIYHFVAKYIIPDLSKPPKDDSQPPTEDVELTETTNGKNPPQTEKKDKPAPMKRPSRDALFRRIMAILYSCVVILFLIILSVLVGVGVY